ncbi:unnamed protein product [Prorocentrum cordatum]|uniref:Uncharacterized protein n=1 Tax=Prorocentrum cordatum TaxID=2364126 RepID=A0ABN9V963_9DINO|nr:unnamed protein product [Polarella glacialis]
MEDLRAFLCDPGGRGGTIMSWLCTRRCDGGSEDFARRLRRTRTVVLNCANIGCVYAANRRRRDGELAGKMQGSYNNFEWEGVRKAMEYYWDRGVTPQGVCKHRTAQLSPVPLDLRDHVSLCPVVDNQAGIDDLFTIRVAMKYGCQLVDNDNYRDWKAGVHEDVRQWLSSEGAGASLKVTYIFDLNGRFLPSLEPPE